MERVYIWLSDVSQSNVFQEMSGSLTFYQTVSEANNAEIVLQNTNYMVWYDLPRVVEIVMCQVTTLRPDTACIYTTVNWVTIGSYDGLSPVRC